MRITILLIFTMLSFASLGQIKKGAKSYIAISNNGAGH